MANFTFRTVRQTVAYLTTVQSFALMTNCSDSSKGQEYLSTFGLCCT